MTHAELSGVIQSAGEFEKRNQDLLALGKRVGEAVVTILPLINLVTSNWETQYPFDDNVSSIFQKSIADLNEYCSFFYPPSQYGGQIDEVAHLTHVVGLNLDSKPRMWRGVPYADSERPSRLKRFLEEYSDLLTDTFLLPEMLEDEAANLNEAPLEKRMEWAHAPVGLEGLRFLPSYRRFDWGKEDKKAGELTLLYKEGVPLDIIQFRKRGGREFFLGSTSGISTFDRTLKDTNKYEPISVITAVKDIAPLQLKSPAIVVDKDGTVSYENWWPEEKENVQVARASFFRAIEENKIPTVLWSRNESVSHFQEDIRTFLGVDLLPSLSFYNWPFFMSDSPELAFDLLNLKSCIDSIPSDLHEVLVRYVQENFGIKAGLPISEYLDILQKQIVTYMTERFRIWRSKKANTFEDNGQSGLACENVLEAKVPLFVGLSQDELPSNIRGRFIKDGVLVNDSEFSLESMKIFGYNFIHVGWVPQVDRAADIINLPK